MSTRQAARIGARRHAHRLLTGKQILQLRHALRGRKLVVCFGGGVDSTAMLVALKRAGIRPDVITFADTRAEKRLTYRHIRRMQRVLAAWGFPPITVVSHRTLEKTGYTDLEGECLQNETLPALAFGLHTCSQKWKASPQNQYIQGVSSGPNARPPHEIWIAAQASGERVVKLIGYDAGPADVRRSNRLELHDSDFDLFYPLQILGWKRQDCVRVIVSVLGPDLLPIKSACFYCPASKVWELYWLAAHEPELFERALVIERNALTGHHSRYDDLRFGDSWDNLVRDAPSFPSSATSVGLGRSFAWCQWALVNGVVDHKFRVKRNRLAHFAAAADELMRADNAFDNRSCGIAA